MYNGLKVVPKTMSSLGQSGSILRYVLWIIESLNIFYIVLYDLFLQNINHNIRFKCMISSSKYIFLLHLGVNLWVQNSKNTETEI